MVSLCAVAFPVTSPGVWVWGFLLCGFGRVVGLLLLTKAIEYSADNS